MQKRNKIILILILFIFIFTGYSFAGIKINGWFNDWTRIPKIYKDKKKDIDTARSGMDFTAVAMKLTKKHLYVFIKGISVLVLIMLVFLYWILFLRNFKRLLVIVLGIFI